MHHSAPPPWRRLTPRLVVVAALIAAFAIAPVSSPAFRPAAQSFDQQLAQLHAQEQQLEGQLQSLQSQQTGATAAALAVQQQMVQTQAQITDAQLHLSVVNQQLAQTDLAVQDATQHLAADRAQLGRMLVSIYERGNVSAVNAVLDSQNMYQLIDRVLALDKTSSQLHDLVSQVQEQQNRLVALQHTQEQDQAQAQADVNQLQALQAQQQAQEVAYQQQVASLTGQQRQVAAQSQQVAAHIASVEAAKAAALAAAAAAAAQAAAARQRGVLQPFAFGPRTDNFPWGQCTWYVASLRDVTWGGDAWMWYAGAQAQGMSTGMQPRVGAIAVWGPGNGYSSYGHVAYVVAVQGSSSFTVNEANYYEVPGQLDARQIDTLSDLEGFIY